MMVLGGSVCDRKARRCGSGRSFPSRTAERTIGREGEDDWGCDGVCGMCEMDREMHFVSVRGR